MKLIRPTTRYRRGVGKEKKKERKKVREIRKKISHTGKDTYSGGYAKIHPPARARSGGKKLMMKGGG